MATIQKIEPNDVDNDDVERFGILTIIDGERYISWGAPQETQEEAHEIADIMREKDKSLDVKVITTYRVFVRDV